MRNRSDEFPICAAVANAGNFCIGPPGRRVWSRPTNRLQRTTARFPALLAALLVVMCTREWSAGEPAASGATVDFSRDIRPILSESCFSCHGPDGESREAELRLDRRESALADRDGHPVITPGNPDKSELLRRVLAENPDERMPPADSGKTLTAQQIETVRRWIEQGAAWQQHWSFVAPKRPEIPQVANREWINNPIDAFVLARLERESLQPSPPADALVLLRRMSLDLIGLPPTLEAVDAFLDDSRSGALRRFAQRLLESEHYGERWGRIWLDAARYADSDGYEKDKPRSVWFYRDWVIDSVNRDLPYDQFIVEQIAGDLLPDASQNQIVATGFLRNSMTNAEGGIDPEQFRMEAMFDRMDAIGKGILGLTIQCGQCHNHKFDPLTQRDYYRMFACINDSYETSRRVYSRQQQTQRQLLFEEIRGLESELQHRAPDWPVRLAQWEDSVRANQPEWTLLDISNAGDNSQRYYRQDDLSQLALGYAPTKHDAVFTASVDLPEIRAFRLELLTDRNLPTSGPGRAANGLCALTEFKVESASRSDPDRKKTVEFVRASADFANQRTRLGPQYADKEGNRGFTGPVNYAIDGQEETAWGIDQGPERRNQSRKAVFATAGNAAWPGGTTLSIVLSQKHGGWNSDDNQNINLGRFRVSVTDDENAVADPVPRRVRRILSIPARQRTPAQLAAVFSYWRTTVGDFQQTNDQIEKLWRDHPEGSTQLVYDRREKPRQTSVLERGDFLKPLESVTPGVLAFLNSPPEGEIDRLALARWLVDRESPTTARAFVNRVWQAYFGIGLVRTSEDLGIQGEPPSHPELLDWLAVEFMDNGWSLKQLHRLIVSSSTYQQSSHVTPELVARDPYNRLLARGPRFRVDAEIVRDIALAASGLLNPKVGGPSVYPPAPEFLFVPPTSYGPKAWNTSTGPDQFRRAMYTFRFRSIPYPVLLTFDAPNADFSCVRRTRSNTPSQALAMLNEPVFMHCAQALASLTLSEGGSSDQQRLDYAFRRCLTRSPRPEESAELIAFLDRQTRRFSRGDADPTQLASGVDDSTKPPARVAAWTTLSRVLLNLDETITKE